jgi:zinc protease
MITGVLAALRRSGPGRLAILGLAGWSMLAAAPAAAATPGVDAPPEAQAPRPIVVPTLHEHRLPNGLTLVVAPRRDLPLVSLMLAVRTGPEADPQGRAGLAEMTASLLTMGVTRHGKAVPATQIAREADALGGTLSAGTGWRSSTATITVMTPKSDTAMALLADVVRRPTFAAAELERARNQSLDGLRVKFAEPGSIATMVARRAFWGASPYGASETPASLKRLTRADVQRFHRQAWRSDRALLVIAGDIDEAGALALARRHLGDWAPPKTPADPPPPPPRTTLATPLVLVDLPGSGQSTVLVTAPFAGLTDADRRAGQVANAVLGGGYSSRLNQAVRVERGLAYGAGSGAESQPGDGQLTASAQTNHPTAAQVLQLIRDQFAALADQPPSAEELAARQAAVVGGFARRLETSNGLSSLIAGQWTNQRPLAALNDTVAEVMSVTPVQVRDFARTHWSAGALRAVVVGDLTAAGAALGGGQGDGGGEVLRIPLEKLDLEQVGMGKR